MPRLSIDITPAERQALDLAVVAHEQPSAAAYVRARVPELLPARPRGWQKGRKRGKTSQQKDASNG